MKYALWTCFLVVGVLAGCGGYDQISPNAYQYSKALYSICNRCDEAKLTQLLDQLATAREKQELTSTEAAWLSDIAATAQAGDWPAAAKEARQLMEEQIRWP
ncbi:MAG: hypothetical protein MI725_06990 [Pirellulales bacterium]|nr:hypothetical protein [Pirellulales bacterium]